MEELIVKRILESKTVFKQNEIDFIYNNNEFVSLLYLIGIMDAIQTINNN